MSFGYDDNVNQTPTDSPGIPDQVVLVPGTPGSASRIEAGIGTEGEATQVTVPGTAPGTRKTVIRGTPGRERVGSFVNRTHVGFDAQFASRKTLFTFDIQAGGTWYWDRPGKDVDYTGSLALMYLRRLTPRLQFTASSNASMQTQPDLSQANTSTTQAGTFLNAGGRLELSYRVTPRFSMVGNINYNTILYQEEVSKQQNYGDTTLGLELRYLYSPRLTLTGQVRYSRIVYTDNTALDANTVFLLLGGEVTLSKRFTGNLLVGASMRTFDQSGQSATSPYSELTVSYQLAQATVVQINARYGFEAPQSADSELISLRGGLHVVQSFSPRLRGTLGTSLARQTTTQTATDVETLSTTIDSTIGFEYNLNRSWTLNANYTYITQFGTNSLGDYYRNQIFLGGQYVF